MKITKSQLKDLIREEIINEIGVPISQIGGGTVVADPHTAAIDSLEDYIANHYPDDDALRELVENVQDLVAEFEDDMQDMLADPLNEAAAPVNTTAPANMIATIAHYFVEIGEYDDHEIARDMVLTMSDDNISKMYPIAEDYFSRLEPDHGGFGSP